MNCYKCEDGLSTRYAPGYICACVRCPQCGDNLDPRPGYVCRCGVESVALTVTGRIPAEHRAGSERVIGSPLAWCTPIPVARIQPRNTVPLFVERFERAMERALPAVPTWGGLVACLAWSLAFVCVAFAWLVMRVWSGEGPRIVTPRAVPLLEERNK